MREALKSAARRQRMTCYRQARRAIDDLVLSHHNVTPELERLLRERMAIRFGRLSKRSRPRGRDELVPKDEVTHDTKDRVCNGGAGALHDC